MDIFGCPLSTFLAYIVSALSVIGSVIWGIKKKYIYKETPRRAY